MTKKIPEWRKAWKLDDPEWVKQRQKDWREISKSPPITDNNIVFSKKEITQIKNYFMTGSEYLIEPDESELWGANYHIDSRPLTVQCNLFFRCWFHPDFDPSLWGSFIVGEHTSSVQQSKNFFRVALKKMYPSKGTLFNGLDKELYYLFGPTRLRREDFKKDEADFYLPKDLDALFNKYCASSLFGLHYIINQYLEEDNPESIVNEVFPEWSDAVVPAFLSFDDYNLKSQTKKLSATFDSVKKIFDSQENFSERQREFAIKFVDTFKKMDLPERMKPIQVLLDEL